MTAGFALYSLVVVGMWSSIGYNIVILLSGLQTISRELYEASALDGAGPVRQFFSITVPMLSPSIFFVTVLSVIGSLQMFDLVYVMVGRTSPALQSTQTVIFLFYERAFVDNDRGYAAAIVFMSPVAGARDDVAAVPPTTEMGPLWLAARWAAAPRSGPSACRP